MLWGSCDDARCSFTGGKCLCAPGVLSQSDSDDDKPLVRPSAATVKPEEDSDEDKPLKRPVKKSPQVAKPKLEPDSDSDDKPLRAAKPKSAAQKATPKAKTPKKEDSEDEDGDDDDEDDDNEEEDVFEKPKAKKVCIINETVFTLGEFFA